MSFFKNLLLKTTCPSFFFAHEIFKLVRQMIKVKCEGRIKSRKIDPDAFSNFSKLTNEDSVFFCFFFLYLCSFEFLHFCICVYFYFKHFENIKADAFLAFPSPRTDPGLSTGVATAVARHALLKPKTNTIIWSRLFKS